MEAASPYVQVEGEQQINRQHNKYAWIKFQGIQSEVSKSKLEIDEQMNSSLLWNAEIN